MEIAELLKISNLPNEIVLEKQALFCRAIEHSAWLFCSLLKPYRPVKQQVKKLNMQVVSIGFPVSSLGNILKLAGEKGFGHTEDTDSHTVRITVNAPPHGSFEEWKATVTTKNTAQVKATAPGHDKLISRLQDYPLAMRSPLETVMLDAG